MILPERFEWQSFENPLEQDMDRPLIWILESENGEIAGHNSILIFPLTVAGTQYTGYCSTNLIVKPGTEGRGLGHILIENNERMGIATAYGPTPASLSAFTKRGWISYTDARLYTIPLHPYRTLRFLKQSILVACLATPVIWVLNAVFGAWRAMTISNKIAGITHREIERFEPAWDEHWQAYLANYAIHFTRRADFLNYRYGARRDVSHMKVIFEQNGVPIGYIVFRVSTSRTKGVTLGRIVDFVYDPKLGEKLPATMIKTAFDALLDKGVDSIVGVAPNDETGRIFKHCGMIFSKIQRMLTKAPEDIDLKALAQPYRQGWYCTLGDADIDNYW